MQRMQRQFRRQTDGLSDEYETSVGLDPADASDATADADGDGISNIDEAQQEQIQAMLTQIMMELVIDQKLKIIWIQQTVPMQVQTLMVMVYQTG